MKIYVFNKQKTFFISSDSVQRAVVGLLSYLSIQCEEIGIYFVTIREITMLHGRFFQDKTPTDCITFPINSSYLGEIFICPAIAKKYIQEHGGDLWEETLLYLVHGILHLAGYKDGTRNERKRMREMEKKCMDFLNSKGIRLA